MINVSYGWAIRFLNDMKPAGNPDPADVGLAIGKILSMETINATPKRALLNALRYCAKVMHLEEWLEDAEMCPREKPRSMTKWIPFTTRPCEGGDVMLILGPCPFCGKTIYPEKYTGLGEKIIDLTLVCANCQYRMRITTDDEDPPRRCSSDVQEIWNRRAE